MHRWLAVFFFVASLTYLVGVWRVGSTVWGDSIYYYAYTRSLVMDFDVDFANESIEPSLSFPNQPVLYPQTQRIVNTFSPGTGLLWIPAFILGQIVTHVLSGIGASVLTNGYSLVTQVMVGLGAVGFGVLGVYFCLHGLRSFFSEKIAIVTIISLLLTTQLFYYILLDPLNSHTASFLFASLSFFLWGEIWNNRIITWKQAFGLGASLGMLGLVRNQDVLTGVILLGSLLFRISSKLSTLKKISLAVGSAVAIGSTQLITSWILFQSWQSPYILSGQSLSWLAPDFTRVLFSSGNGFFRYAPTAVICLAGLFILAKTKRWLAVICLLVFLAQLYVIASWGPEIVGGPYGSRMFVGTLPFLSVGLAQVLTTVKNRLIIFMTAILFAWNLYQIGVMLVRW
ncbi:MAG: hypothetical protein GW946_01685 [Candidatus Pacebacteria bacterium]|nr:hypothetical protein [Candidatus Paceibacterota bacterium]